MTMEFLSIKCLPLLAALMLFLIEPQAADAGPVAPWSLGVPSHPGPPSRDTLPAPPDAPTDLGAVHPPLPLRTVEFPEDAGPISTVSRGRNHNRGPRGRGPRGRGPRGRGPRGRGPRGRGPRGRGPRGRGPRGRGPRGRGPRGRGPRGRRPSKYGRPHSAEGRGDPHLTGFDGSVFDFHGIHGKHYVLFGRPTGEFLVTKMRSAEDGKGKNVAKKTFFDEFGLHIPDSNDNIKVSLAKSKCAESGHWCPKVEVNGEQIDKALDLRTSRIRISPAQTWVSIVTKETDFFIPAKLLDDDKEHHMNLVVKLIQPPVTPERYVGVLGVSLNRALGHTIHPNLHISDKDVIERRIALETAMRGRFEVGSLFPERDDGDDLHSLSGVVAKMES